MGKTIAANVTSGRIARVAFGLVLILLAVTAVVALGTIRSAVSSGGRVDHTLAIEKELASLSSSVGVTEAAYLHLRAVRALIDQMTAEEERLLRERTQRASAAAKRASVAATASCLFALFAIYLGFLLLRNEARTRRTALATIQRSERGPSATPDGIGDAATQLREVRASETMFRGLLEAAPDAVVIVERGGTIVRVNGQAERLFGYSRQELLGQPVEILIPERIVDKHVAHRKDYLDKPLARAMGSGLELHGRRKDGSEFPVEISLSPLESEDGILVSSAIREISERKRADEQRFRLAALVDSSDDAIIGKTLAGVVTSWNRGAQRLFGYSADEMIGQPITRLIPANRLDEEARILDHLAHGQVERFDTVRVRKDGLEIDVSVTSSPVRDSAGRLIGASKVVRDITDRHRAAEALARAKEATDTANRELEAFSYSVAHDLRAPLRGMNGFAQVLLNTYKDKLDAEGRDWLEEIVLNAKKMGGLIDALLALARVTRSELKPERVDLSRIAREEADRLSASETSRAVEIDVQEHLHADMDSRLARAVVQNLIGNAWKFTGKVATGHIEFGANETDGVRTFFVRDNGAGFDMTFANNLFAPFQRLHTAAEFPGTGIGLATVLRIVQRHGGNVWAEGKVDGGATFYFTVPTRSHGATAS